jgi:hypothetical protein
MTNIEAIEILDSMKVKIDIPNAAVTQQKRNEALEMAIRSLTNAECVDAIMNEVCKKISVPVQSGYRLTESGTRGDAASGKAGRCRDSDAFIHAETLRSVFSVRIQRRRGEKKEKGESRMKDMSSYA